MEGGPLPPVGMEIIVQYAQPGMAGMVAMRALKVGVEVAFNRTMRS
jgi:hypothetical protein